MDRQSAIALIRARIEASIDVKQRILETPRLIEAIAAVSERAVTSLREGGKLMVCGNGGSAADAQHIAAELVGRFLIDRRALPALALTTDTSALTAIANDFDFADVFARQIEALGRAGDLVLLLSTSGNSPNVLRAAEAARQRGMTAVGLTGADGGKLRHLVDVCLCVPGRETPRVQEAHIMVGHILCEMIERGVAPHA